MGGGTPLAIQALALASRGVRKIGVWGWLSLVVILLAATAKALQSTLYIFGYDDDVYVRMAYGFVHGHWSSGWRSLGPSALTRGPGWPIFLAASHVLPWTPPLSVFLLYLVGVALIGLSWYLLRGSRAQAFVVLAFLTLNPVFFTVQNQQIERDTFICAVSTISIGLFLVIGQRITNDLGIAQLCLLTAMAVVVGTSVGIVDITKESWVWLMFGLAALGLPFVTQLVRHRGWRSVSARVGLILVAFFTGFFAIVQSCKAMNNRTYHVALVEDWSTGAFARAWKLWASVEAGNVRPFVTITFTMRAAVYDVSPTAAKLAPYLESRNEYFKGLECQSAVHICNESGNWFPWDLLSAATVAGRLHSVSDIQAFFSKIADDIAKACSDGKLRCSTSPVLGTGLPPLNEIPLAAVVSDTAHGIQDMVWNRLPIGPTPSAGFTPAEYRLWSSVVSGMPSEQSLRRPPPSSIIYAVLRFLDVIYGISNLALIALAAAGAGASAVVLSSRARLRRRGDSTSGAAIAVALLAAPLLGMVTLAVFEATQGYPYVNPLYWTDFATPMELALVVGGLTGWTNLVRRAVPPAWPTVPTLTISHRSRWRRRRDHRTEVRHQP
jgi:hypothetical protein